MGWGEARTPAVHGFLLEAWAGGKSLFGGLPPHDSEAGTEVGQNATHIPRRDGVDGRLPRCWNLTLVRALHLPAEAGPQTKAVTPGLMAVSLGLARSCPGGEHCGHRPRFILCSLV